MRYLLPILVFVFMIFIPLSMLAIVAKNPTQPPAQYWPSISEMQEFAGAEVDGVWGPETDRLYRAAQERWYCDEMYKKSLNGVKHGEEADQDKPAGESH